MDFFDWLPTAKLNDVDLTYPDDITLGISPIIGMLGQEWDYDDKFAKKFSKTSAATLRWGKYKLGRLDSSMTTAIGSAVRGRPVFWVDESKYIFTCDAAANKKFAGFLLNSITVKGNVSVIQSFGRVGALFAASLTKATPAIMDICTLSIGSSLATLDVLADATQPTMAQLVSVHNIRSQMAVASPTANAVNEVYCSALGIHSSGAQ